MKVPFYRTLIASVSIMLCMALWNCAGRPYLIVDYHVPMASQALEGQTIHLKIEDKRSEKAIMSKDAVQQFQDFNGRYSLAMVMPDKERRLAGEYDLTELFQTAFEKRLDLMGAKATDVEKAGTPSLTITLKQFKIDLQGRKWLAHIAYEANLSRQGHPNVKEIVQGSAERIKVVGRKGADTVIGELFTDVVNRTDLAKLFQRAKLMP